MIKLQFNGNAGIYQVKEFDSNVKIWDSRQNLIMELSRDFGEGWFGIEVDQEMFDLINNEFGIHKLRREL
jgi:hypothetical protein